MRVRTVRVTKKRIEIEYVTSKLVKGWKGKWKGKKPREGTKRE